MPRPQLCLAQQRAEAPAGPCMCGGRQRVALWGEELRPAAHCRQKPCETRENRALLPEECRAFARAEHTAGPPPRTPLRSFGGMTRGWLAAGEARRGMEWRGAVLGAWQQWLHHGGGGSWGLGGAGGWQRRRDGQQQPWSPRGLFIQLKQQSPPWPMNLCGQGPSRGAREAPGSLQAWPRGHLVGKPQ